MTRAIQSFIAEADPLSEVNNALLEVGYLNRGVNSDPEESVWLLLHDVCTEEIEETEETEESEESEEIKEIKEKEESQECEEIHELPTGVWERIDKAILTCIVGSDGNTNAPLFDLAREVSACEEHLVRRFSLRLLRQILQRWRSANLRNLNPDKDYLIEFLDKLYLVLFPAGIVLVKAFEKAKTQRPPGILREFSPGVQLLGCLCRELQRLSGEKPFFVDGRAVAKVLGEAHRTVASWLRALCSPRLGMIRVVSKGRPGKASRYRYLEPIPE